VVGSKGVKIREAINALIAVDTAEHGGRLIRAMVAVVFSVLE
jgi:hypothetical protein